MSTTAAVIVGLIFGVCIGVFLMALATAVRDPFVDPADLDEGDAK